MASLMLLLSAEALAPSSPTSWQRRLDRALLDVDRTPKARIQLLKKVIEDSPTVVQDVRSAVDVLVQKGFKEGHPEAIDTLWPAGTTARSDLEGLQALRKQVPEVVQSFIGGAAQPDSLPRPPSPEDAKAIASALAGLATDPEKQQEALEEAKNALRRTPKGLETPRYSVVRAVADTNVELRAYEPFTVARKRMGSSSDSSEPLFGTSAEGAGFNALARYLFGENSEASSMAMTMPVEIEGGAAPSMSFVIPKSDAEAPPQPTVDGISLEEVPARLVAVKPFAGIVTDDEVERQRKDLLSAIAGDDSIKAVDEAVFSVLQYNSPLTIPWRRRNEIAIVVTDLNQPPSAHSSDEPESVKSWYDSGVRLSPSVTSWYDSGVRL